MAVALIPLRRLDVPVIYRRRFDRSIADQRLFPAINLAESGTRHEEKLLGDIEFKTVSALRRRLMNMKPVVQIEQLLKAVERFPPNDDLVRG